MAPGCRPANALGQFGSGKSLSFVRPHTEMQSYAWTCFACQRGNAAGTERCAHCNFPTSASTAEIEAAQARITPVQATTPQPAPIAPPPFPESQSRSEPSALVALLMVAFGVFCLFGSYKSFTGGHWPAFMPPQLDLIAVPLSWLSERLGAFVGGALSALVGLVCIVGGVASAKRRNAAMPFPVRPP